MYKCTSRVKCFPPLVIDAAMILTFFWYMQTIVMSVTFPQQGDNTRGVALLFCPIYPKMRFEPLHDLVKKIGFITIEEGCVALLQLLPIKPSLS